MKRFDIRALGKSFALCLVAFAFLAASAAEARADEVTISGTTSGVFTVPQLTFAGVAAKVRGPRAARRKSEGV